MRSFILYFFIASTLLSQDIFRAGFGINYNIPSGDFAKNFTPSFGYSVRTEYEIDETITSSMILSINKYEAELPSKVPIIYKSKKEISSIELMIGLQYKIFNNTLILLTGGMNYISLPKEYYIDFGQAIEGNTKTEAYYIISPGIGYRNYISDKINLLITSKYALVNGQFSNFNKFTFECNLLIDLDL